MKIASFLYLLFFLPYPSPSHDIALATFDITKTSKGIALDIKMDKEDLEAALQETQGDGSPFTVDKKALETYLTNKTTWVFNGQHTEFEVIGFSTNRLFYLIQCEAITNDSPIHKITVKNTCLLEQVPKHSNIIHFRLGEHTRSFRMYEGRKEISLRY